MAIDADAADAELTGVELVRPNPLDDEPWSPAADGSAPAIRQRPARPALIASLLIVASLAGLVGWLSYRTYESHRADEQRQRFLQVGKQGALNLTTIDYTTVDTDVTRILDCSTGRFYDDFHKRSQPFIDVVKKAQSKSVGTIAEAGLESATGGDEARVLVAVQVKTSNAGAPEQQPRGWRIRIDVRKVGADVKVANVEFVP